MSQVSGTSVIGSGAWTESTNQFSGISSEQFIKIMITELTNQDPFSPSDTSALLDQINTIRSIESDMQLTRRLEELVSENQFASASNLIGKFVGGYTEDFYGVTGYVVSVIRQGENIYLELDTGWFIPFENVETVIDPSIFDPQPDDPDDPSSPQDDSSPSPDSALNNDDVPQLPSDSLSGDEMNPASPKQ